MGSTAAFGSSCSFRGPLSVLEVDLVKEICHSLEGFGKGGELDAEDVEDLLRAAGS